MQAPLLVNPEEAARVLGIGRTRTYALIASGELQSVKLGRARRIPRTALEDYVARLVAEQNGPEAA